MNISIQRPPLQGVSSQPENKAKSALPSCKTVLKVGGYALLALGAVISSALSQQMHEDIRMKMLNSTDSFSKSLYADILMQQSLF